MQRWTRVLVAALVVVVCSSARAELKLPSIIDDGMVLQRKSTVTIWGTADPGAKVTVEVAGKRGDDKADKDGRFAVRLKNLPTGGPYQMAISTSTGDQRRIENVLVGEVWVCSGQSNMQWPMTASLNPEQEIAGANYPQIRLFEVPRRPADEPQEDVQAKWAICSPQTIASFSAVAYFFGRELHQELGVPIGLISSNYGGTPAEAWTSRPALKAEASLKPLLERWENAIATYDAQQAQAQYEQRLAQWEQAAEKARAEGQPVPVKPQPPVHPAASQHRPSGLYNAMIAPLTNYAIAGAIWYQGESNVTRAHQYRTIFPAMIRDWRRAWGDKDLPFYFVQLAPYRYGLVDPKACAELWEAQLLTHKSVPNTGMAVINDVGDIRDIHPKNKQVVGRRLALWALAKNYGHKDLVYGGPLFKDVDFKGDQAIVKFDHIGSGLASRDGQPLTHFELAGEDQQFHPATAEIVGKTVVVRSQAVTKPVALRFAWSDTAEPNLMNKEGLPASPFRSDKWKGVTEGVD